MKHKRNLKTKVFLWLRKMGMLCKTPQPYTPHLRISHTVRPDVDLSPIDTERYVFMVNKKSSRNNCKFNIDSQTCKCGANLDQFLNKCNTLVGEAK